MIYLVIIGSIIFILLNHKNKNNKDYCILLLIFGIILLCFKKPLLEGVSSSGESDEGVSSSGEPDEEDGGEQDGDEQSGQGGVVEEAGENERDTINIITENINTLSNDIDDTNRRLNNVTNEMDDINDDINKIDTKTDNIHDNAKEQNDLLQYLINQFYINKCVHHSESEDPNANTCNFHGYTEEQLIREGNFDARLFCGKNTEDERLYCDPKNASLEISIEQAINNYNFNEDI